MQNVRNCGEMNIPLQAWRIHKIVTSELRQQVRQTRRIVTELNEQSSEKMDFYAKEVEQTDHARRAFLEPSVAPRPPAAETEVEDRSSVREAKRAREEPAQDLSGEIPIPSADETLTKSGDPCGAMLDSNSDFSWSLFKYRTAESSWSHIRQRCEACV